MAEGLSLEQLKARGAKPVQPSAEGLTLEELQARGAKPSTSPTPTLTKTSPFLQGGVKIPVVEQLSNIGKGIGAGVGKAGIGIGQTAVKGVGALANLLSPGTSKEFTDPLVQTMESLKQNIYEKPFSGLGKSISGQAGLLAGEAVPYIAPTGGIIRGQQAITGLASKLPVASKFLKGTVGVLGRGAVEAGATGATGFAVSGGDVDRAKADAFIAGSLSTGLGAIGALGRGAKQSGVAKSVFSKTTGIPKTAFDAVDGIGINKGATPEQALEKSRNAVKLLRMKTSQLWEESLPAIANEYKGIRTGLSDNQIKSLIKVADEFNIEPSLLPQNLKQFSAIEGLNLMKALNSLDSLAVKSSPKGASVRALKKELRPLILKTFGGDEGMVSKLWQQYALKSTILENMDSIVKAYKTVPTQTVTAKNRLMAIFDANKPEFLQAVKDIEKELGINLTQDIASTKFANILPQGILKADGGLPTRAGIVDKLIKGLFLPVTSPKLAGKLAISGTTKEAGELGKRVLGDYRVTSQNKPATTQTPTTATPSSASPISAKSITTDISPTIPQNVNKSKSSLNKLFPTGKEGQRGFIGTGGAKEAFNNYPDLTAKHLSNLEGKTSVSKQFILDTANRPELRQVERDLIRDVVNEFPDGNINVQEYADKIKARLLPLDVKGARDIYLSERREQGGRYEHITLPDEIRGNVADYSEKIYESPIKTTAGQVHFGQPKDQVDNYFAHTRIEDMADGKTRRVIEAQSDLFQKGRLEREGTMPYDVRQQQAEKLFRQERNIPEGFVLGDTQQKELAKFVQELNRPEIAQLQPYRNTWHERIIREEIQRAAKDGKTKLQFPTGETAMKIEGLGDTNNWVFTRDAGRGISETNPLTPSNLGVGNAIKQGNTGENWIVTEVLGDGKFKATQQSNIDFAEDDLVALGFDSPDDVIDAIAKGNKKVLDLFDYETFDISGKVDTSNPIYKFYEKEVQKFLKRIEPNAKRVTDAQGVEWIEIPIKKEYAGQPVQAFGSIATSPLMVGAGVGLGIAVGMGAITKAKKADVYASLRKELLPNEILVRDKKGNIGAIDIEDFDATIYEKL